MLIDNPALLEWQRACAYKRSLRDSDETMQVALTRQYQTRHGHFDQWLAGIKALAPISVSGQNIVLNTNAPSVALGLDKAQHQALKQAMQSLIPWRKGPFALGELYIDSEWRSDVKYQRLLDLGVDIADKQVLDVGSGNGYFLYRLLGSGASLALGVDPSWHYFAQFLALQHCYQQSRACYLPMTLDDCLLKDFDVTLSMGVLYHRRDPMAHLWQLRETLRAGGCLVLETLVVEGDAQTVFLPPQRYAGMKNVWFLPSLKALCAWLERLGFRVEQCGECVKTTSAEQRATEWLQRQSLSDFMNADFSTTIEHLPPPQRVMIVARKPA